MFELPSTKARLKKAEDKAIKIGQKDRRDAAKVRLSVHLPNSALEQFDPALRGILYGKGSPGEKAMRQAKVEGMEEVTDFPSLTRTGQNLMTLNWGEEQTGCELVIDYGAGKGSDIVLREGTTKSFKISLQEGGSVKVDFTVHAPTDGLSNEVLGKLHRLHETDVTITLKGPQIDQTSIDDVDTKPAGGGNVVTPIAALAGSVKREVDAANKPGSGKATA